MGHPLALLGFAPVTCKRARYCGVYIDFLNDISLSPLYKGVGHRNSTMMRSPRRPRSSVLSFSPSPAGILKLKTQLLVGGGCKCAGIAGVIGGGGLGAHSTNLQAPLPAYATHSTHNLKLRIGIVALQWRHISHNSAEKSILLCYHYITRSVWGVPQCGGQIQQWPTSVRIGYITPAVWGGSPTLQSRCCLGGFPNASE